MIGNGTGPTKLDTRDYSYHRTFPQFGAIMPPGLPLLDYNYDIAISMPDQLADGLPLGCTGETQTDLKQDQDGCRYDPRYTYEKTCFMEGHGPEKGCDIRTSSKALRVYGAKKVGGTEDNALKNKSGQTFNVDKAKGRDWFDSFRVALRVEKQGISGGTIWFPEWSTTDANGVVTSNFYYDGHPEHYSWHNYAIKGEKVMNGIPFLRVKSWQGTNVGDQGWLYFDRATFNKAFDIWGTVGLITAKANPDDIKTIKADLWQTVFVYLNRLIGLFVNYQHKILS